MHAVSRFGVRVAVRVLLCARALLSFSEDLLPFDCAALSFRLSRFPAAVAFCSVPDSYCQLDVSRVDRQVVMLPWLMGEGLLAASPAFNLRRAKCSSDSEVSR